MSSSTPAPVDGLIRLGPSSGERRLVLLHGWGADADDLLDLAPLLVDPAVSVVALRAPLPHPGGSGRQWYDLQQPDWPQLPAARADLRRRLEALAQEVPLERTVLLGFSQGAAMAVDVATGSGGLPLAGLISCSGYPHPGWQARAARGPQRLLLTHGQQDPVVPFAASEALQEQLRAAGHEAELLGFAGGHSIAAELFPALGAYLVSSWPG